MSRGGEQGAVVVAVDDDGSAGDAVDWAAAEAATRRCPLRVVHAARPPLPTDPYGIVPPIDSLIAARAAAELLLVDATTRARSVASDLAVSTRLMHGSAGWTLLGEARGAQLLVVGSHGRSGLRGLLAGSVSAHVAAHASCPVVVVRPANNTSAAGPAPNAAARAAARVVVGVDLTPTCTRAIGFAFQAARQRGIPLTAMHAWTPDPPADLEAISGSPTMAEALARRATEKGLARWRDEYTDVPVVTELTRGDPAQALVTASRGAALVVVGSRGRGHILGTVLGSVSQTVLHHAHCPVAIVRHDCATAAEPPTALHHGRAS
jgi:nucleotide-binding universal stress UspA family protein